VIIAIDQTAVSVNSHKNLNVCLSGRCFEKLFVHGLGKEASLNTSRGALKTYSFLSLPTARVTEMSAKSINPFEILEQSLLTH